MESIKSIINNILGIVVGIGIVYALQMIYKFRVEKGKSFEGKDFLKLVFKKFATIGVIVLILMILSHLLGGR